MTEIFFVKTREHVYFSRSETELCRVTVDALITAHFSLDVNVVGAPPRSRYRDHTSWFFLRDERASTLLFLPSVTFPRVRVLTRSPTLRIAVHHLRKVLQVEGQSFFRSSHNISFPGDRDIGARSGWIIVKASLSWASNSKFITSSHCVLATDRDLTAAYFSWRERPRCGFICECDRKAFTMEVWRRKKVAKYWTSRCEAETLKDRKRRSICNVITNFDDTRNYLSNKWMGMFGGLFCLFYFCFHSGYNNYIRHCAFPDAVGLCVLVQRDRYIGYIFIGRRESRGFAQSAAREDTCSIKSKQMKQIFCSWNWIWKSTYTRIEYQKDVCYSFFRGSKFLTYFTYTISNNIKKIFEIYIYYF